MTRFLISSVCVCVCVCMCVCVSVFVCVYICVHAVTILFTRLKKKQIEHRRIGIMEGGGGLVWVENVQVYIHIHMIICMYVHTLKIH